jgi:hypothetical protein
VALVAREPQFNRSHVHERIVGGLRVLLLGGLRGAHLATATGSVVGVSIENLNPTEEVLGGLEKGCDDESGAFESDTRGGKRLSLSLSRARARQKNKGFLARWSSVDWTSVDGSPFVVVVVAFLELWRDPISFG